MKCFYCSEQTLVLETRDTKRRRICTNGHRFITQEVEMFPEQLRPTGRSPLIEDSPSKLRKLRRESND